MNSTLSDLAHMKKMVTDLCGLAQNFSGPYAEGQIAAYRNVLVLLETMLTVEEFKAKFDALLAEAAEGLRR